MNMRRNVPAEITDGEEEEIIIVKKTCLVSYARPTNEVILKSTHNNSRMEEEGSNYFHNNLGARLATAQNDK